MVATFVCTVLLGAGPSTVTAAVSEFTCQPVVIATRRCIQMPAALFARTALAEAHTVRSAVLPPIRDGLLYSAVPTCEPSNVTLVDPVAAALLILALLCPGASIVIDTVSEFTCQPVVIDTRRCVQMPAALFARTDVPDIHTVRSTVLPPNRDGLL